MRGVYISSAIGWLRDRGSSPLARGLPLMVSFISFSDRIIPACAGFTYGWLDKFRMAPDHPRLRGVYHASS